MIKSYEVRLKDEQTKYEELFEKKQALLNLNDEIKTRYKAEIAKNEPFKKRLEDLIQSKEDERTKKQECIREAANTKLNDIFNKTALVSKKYQTSIMHKQMLTEKLEQTKSLEGRYDEIIGTISSETLKKEMELEIFVKELLSSKEELDKQTKEFYLNYNEMQEQQERNKEMKNKEAIAEKKKQALLNLIKTLENRK